MAWTGTPVKFTGATITLGGAELGHASGGSSEWTYSVTGDMADMGVNGSAPHKETCLAGNVQATGTISYVIDAGVNVIDFGAQAEAALVVTVAGDFVFTAQVWITGSDGGFSQGDVMKGTLNYVTSGPFTFSHG